MSCNVIGTTEIKTYDECKDSIEWRIPDFFTLTDSVSVYSSPASTVNCSSWFLKMSVTDQLLELNIISLFIETDVKRDYPIEYSIGIKKSDGRAHRLIGGILEGSKKYTYPYLVLISDLREKQSELVPDGICTIIFTMKREINNSCSQPTASNGTTPTKLIRKRKFQADYEELLLSGKHSDSIINVKGMRFEAHKLILGARSSVFATLLGEKIEKNQKTMDINDANPEIFREFLLYLYTGDEDNLDWKNIVELYKLGDKYCVEDLKELCVERMKTNTSVENFFEIFLLSRQINDLELSAAIMQFFLENSKEIIEREGYVEFMKDYPDDSYELIKALVANR